MRLRLKWNDTNVNPHTVTIYRSDTAPLSNPTGPGLVTLTAGETQWDDTTVVRGNTYWYTLKVSNGTTDIYTAPLKLTALPRTGPGPQTLIDGDLDLGYYGPCTQTELFSHAAFYKLFTPGGSVNTDVNPTIWYKFARNGKTLFVPQIPIATGVNWNLLYNAGLIYGTDDTGVQNGGLTPVNQRRIAQVGIDRFIVRCPTGFDDRTNPNRITPAGVAPSDSAPFRRYSELSDLFLCMLNNFHSCQRFARTAPYFASTAGGWNSSSGVPITQEIDPTAKTVTLINSIQPAISTLPATVSALTSTGAWRPVLELIDELDVAL